MRIEVARIQSVNAGAVVRRNLQIATGCGDIDGGDPRRGLSARIVDGHKRTCGCRVAFTKALRQPFRDLRCQIAARQPLPLARVLVIGGCQIDGSPVSPLVKVKIAVPQRALRRRFGIAPKVRADMNHRA